MHNKPSDTLTVLTSFGPKMVKTWRRDGTILGYDRAKHFRVDPRTVSDIYTLSSELALIEPCPTTVVIRGEPKPGTDLNYTERTLQAFEEKPRRWLALDIDSFIPLLHDPVAEPELAIRDFIEQHLPVEFHQATFHWQLTGSAGKPSAEHVLRARLWFWLTEPRGQAELEAWARGQKIPVDVTVFRTVQAVYSGAPVIEEGAVCPVTRRSGLVQGERDDVDLQLTDDMLAAGRAPRGKARGEMVDPTEKPGLVGLFCRLYPPARVIDEDLVEGSFEWQDDSDVRINWLTSVSGSAGGVCITDDELHFFCSHNEDPFEGRACNAWDFVRVHRFGELDDSVDSDAVAWLMAEGGMPSHLAMKAWVRTLPDVAAELEAAEAERQAVASAQQDQAAAAEAERAGRAERRVQEAIDKIVAAASAADLERVVCPALAGEDWSDGERERLAVAVQQGFRRLAGAPLPIATARGWLRLPAAPASSSSPGWLDEWVFIRHSDRFYNLITKTDCSPRGFDIKCSPEMPLSADGVHRERASDYAQNVWHIRSVDNLAYAPGMKPVFEMFGKVWANTYDESTVPAAGPGGEAAIRMFQAHLARLVPDERERALLLSWMAHNVRYPGRKIRWSPYVFGCQGSGKTFLAEVLKMVMGDANASVLSGEVLLHPFTGWKQGHAVVAVEEVYQSGHLKQIEELLKEAVSNNRVSVHRKGKDAYQAPNFTNYLLLSNHPNGLPVSDGDRRYYFIEAAISKEDAKALSAEGYFHSLFETCRKEAAGLRRWLLEEAPMHEEFDPDGHAPVTAVRSMVIEMSRSDSDLTIADLLEGKQATTTSWVSTRLKEMDALPKWNGAISKMLASADFRFLKHMRVAGHTRRVYVRVGSERLSDDAIRAALAYAHAEEWGDAD